jgi:hypothetical protein
VITDPREIDMAAGIVRSRSGNLFTDWPAGSDEAFSRRGGEQQKLKRLFVATGKGAEPFANLRRPPPPCQTPPSAAPSRRSHGRASRRAARRAIITGR